MRRGFENGLGVIARLVDGPLLLYEPTLEVPSYAENAILVLRDLVLSAFAWHVAVVLEWQDVALPLRDVLLRLSVVVSQQRV